MCAPIQEEPVSCYCSASHTDNNYSTDEHDSVRDSAHRPANQSLTQKLGLHQSDSGADLSEYHDQHEAKSIQGLLATYEKAFDTPNDKVSNDIGNPKNFTQYRENENCDLSSEAVECDNIEKGLTEEASENLCSPCTETSNRPSFTLGNNSDTQNLTTRKCKKLSLNNAANDTAVDIGVISLSVGSPQQNETFYPALKKTVEEAAWEKFWSEHGEQLIWASWIEKYVDYINPGYLQEAQANEDQKIGVETRERPVEKYPEQNTCFPNQAHKNCELGRSSFEGIFGKSESANCESRLKDTSSNLSFTFENTHRASVNDKEAEENRTKMVNNELSPEAGDGWNPLSPFSAEESYYNQQSNGEDERLIAMSRCDSINGSIAKTNATSDSMTNVTKMTLTSSSFDSNSAQSFSLVSSVTSSIESNVTSSSSDQENEINSEDNDKYWQHLWKENFQLQYQIQYEKFLAKFHKDHPAKKSNDVTHALVKENSGKSIEKQNESTENPVPQKSGSRKNSSSRREGSNKKKMIIESVGALMQNLTMKSEETMENDSEANDDQQTQGVNGNNDFVTPHNSNNTKTNINSNSSSGNTNRRSSSGGDGDKPNEDKPITLKRR